MSKKDNWAFPLCISEDAQWLFDELIRQPWQ